MAARGLRFQMGLSGEDARQAAIALAFAPACLVVDRALPLRFIALGAQQRDLRPKVRQLAALVGLHLPAATAPGTTRAGRWLVPSVLPPCGWVQERTIGGRTRRPPVLHCYLSARLLGSHWKNHRPLSTCTTKTGSGLQISPPLLRTDADRVVPVDGQR